MRPSYIALPHANRLEKPDGQTHANTALRDTLEAARLQAIQELASVDGTTPSVSTEALQRVAFLQIALVAVRKELAAYAVKVGGGTEQALD